MKKENNILDEYFSKSNMKIPFKKVKELYIKMLNTTNDTEKNSIRDNIISCVIYKLHKHIKDNLLFEFDSGYINKDDIIQDLYISSIEFVDEGQLLNFNSYTTFFFHLLYYRLNGKYRNFKYYYDFFNRYFILLVEYYYNNMNVNGIVSYYDFYNYSKNLDNDVSNNKVCNAYNIIENIFSDFEKEDDISFNNITFLKKFKDIIIQKYLDFCIEYEILEDKSKISYIDDRELEREIRSLLECLNFNNKYVLSKRIGLDCDIETFDDIAKDLNLLHRSNTSGLYRSALSILYKKHIKELKKLRLMYDGSKSK